MAEVKAGDLNLLPLDHQWRKNYQTLITTNDVNKLMAIIESACKNSMERKFYQDWAFDRLFSSAGGADIREYVGATTATGLGAVAGAGAAATLGATTTSWGLFGVTLFTTITAAPVALVAGAAAGAGALGYGAYKLISRAAQDKGKEEQFAEAKSEGRYDSNPTRTLNPYIFSNDVIKIYKILRTLSNPDWQEFLKLFDSSVLNAELIKTLKKFGAKDDDAKENLRNSFTKEIKQYLSKVEAKYNQENSKLIKTCAAFMEINNEFALPRLVQEDRKVAINAIRKRKALINYETMMYEEFLALFSLYKMLLNHPANTSKQRELQLAKMHKRARELGDMAEKVFDDIVSDTRIIKLDHTNYLHYLQEIVDVLEQEQARAFIETLLKDLEQCMLVDDKLESYEQELLQGIIDSTHLQGTNFAALLESYK